MRVRLGLAMATVMTGTLGCAARHAERPMSAQDRTLAVRSFDEMWTIVRDRHFDPKYNGVDWEAVKVEFGPRVEASITHGESVRFMNEALGRLDQSHFAVISSDAYEGVTGKSERPKSNAEEPAEGEVGLDVRVIHESAVVVAVDRDSPADRAGIKPGWRVLESNGKKVGVVLAAVDKAFAGQVKRDGMASLALRHLVRGPLGETLRLKLEDGSGKARTIKLEAVGLSGTPVVFGHLPPFHLEYDARRLAGGAAYLRFSVFFDPATVMPWYRERVREFADAPGLVIDLRGNPGGLGGMAMGMGNMLVETPNQKLGTMTSRDAVINFVLNPQVGSFKGPIAILIDELSMSTSEIMAGGLQAIGRARVFGVRSSGLALPSQVVKLASGDGFQFATADYVSADGKVLEGHGVEPDETVRPDPKALLEGRDVVIEAAETWIRSKGNPAGD